MRADKKNGNAAAPAKFRPSIAGAGAAVLAAVLTVGVKTVFGPCGVHEDGTYSPCHAASNTVALLGLVLLLAGLLLTFLKNRTMRLVLGIAGSAAALICAFVPGHLMPLCSMATMRCVTVMKPAVFVLGILLAVLLACIALAAGLGRGRGHRAR